MLGLVPGLELGLLEEELDSLEDCLSPDWTADLGRVLGPGLTEVFTVPELTISGAWLTTADLLVITMAACSLCRGTGGPSEPELGLSWSLEPEENHDSRHDSQLEY